MFNPYFDLYSILSNQDTDLQLQARKKLIWAYSWAIPNRESIEALSELSPLVELGAGTGYWAWTLEQAGARVVALDQEPSQPPHWHPIESGDESKLCDFPDHSLFLCWPPFQSKMAELAIETYRGKTVIYVGEWNGRTANSYFHKKLEDHWKLVKEIKIPNWPGYQDKVYIFTR